MAAAPKIAVLGQSQPASTSATLYTVPAGRRAVISTLTVAETGGATAKYRIHVGIGGVVASAANALAYDISLDANAHDWYTEGWTLAAGDKIYVVSTTDDVTFTLFGEETDVPE